MHAEEFAIDERCQRHVVKRIHYDRVEVLVKLVLAFVPKVEEGRELSAFVVSAQQVDTIWIRNFHRVEEEHDFDGERAPINEVAEEHILRLVGLSPHLQKLEQIIKLAVDVPNDSQRIVNMDDISLILST